MQAYKTSYATVLLSSLAMLQFALFIGYFPFAIIVTPYGDVLDWLNGFYNLPDQSLWQYLWAPHNGHRLVFSKLLTVSDAELFGGLSYPIAAVCLMLLLIAAATALSSIRRSVTNTEVRRWVTAVTVLLLFPTSSYASFAYPVNSQHLIVSFFVFMACVLLARSAVVEGSKSERNIYFSLALLAGVCASLAALNGLIIWPILVWMVWALRLGRAYGVALATLGTLVIAGFSYHYPIASETAGVANGLGDLAHIAKYLIEYHAMPWVEVGVLFWPAMLLGLAILLLSIFSLKKLFSPHSQQPISIVALAMLTFSLATAAIIAIGRHTLDLLPAHRYAIFLLIAFVALFVLHIPRFEHWMSSGRGRVMVMSTTLVFALGYLAQQVAVGQFAVQRADTFAQYEKDFLAGGRDTQATTALYLTGVDTLERHYRMLEQQRIYVFRPIQR